ncbi:MAG: hypothetical protein ACP5NW_00605 [Candidatus Woesearchaeota archaeon]
MLNLRRDLYARLVISSHKDKRSNAPFRVAHVETSTFLSVKKIREDAERSKMEKELSRSPISKPVVPEFISKKTIVEKIDDKVINIIDDPKISEIKTEIEFAEALLKKIKSLDADNKKIPVIEENISRLRAMLNQKMYV